MASPEEIIKARAKTHGDWHCQSSTSQTLKAVMKNTPNWTRLSPGQQEGLEMSAVKIARALHGDFTHPDHWDDLVGYANLARESADGSENY